MDDTLATLTPPELAVLLSEAAIRAARKHRGLIYAEADFRDLVGEIVSRLVPYARDPKKRKHEIEAIAFTIARNLEVDRARRNVREAEYASLEGALGPATEPTWTSKADPHVASELVRVINALPEECRETLKRHVLEGRSFAQIARELGIPESTIKRRYVEAVEAIRVSLTTRAMDDSRVREAISRWSDG